MSNRIKYSVILGALSLAPAALAEIDVGVTGTNAEKGISTHWRLNQMD
ncbi:MAG: hypothetical protein HRU20_24760 [Pseudomonadales bacterium]|nr:hypothetical protein [Pseudomonadales bacterium]